MITAVNCCVGCPRQGCGAYHDKCPQYQDEVSKRNADKAKIRKDNEFRSILAESVERCKKINQHRKGNFICAMK